jgi:transcription initiation factor IIF auxiliary subunit
LKHQIKHFFYAAGWKKFELFWDLLIRARQLAHITPLLEAVLFRVTGTHATPTVKLAEGPFSIIEAQH